MKRFIFFLTFVAICHSINAQLTIHVLSPWRDDNAEERRENLRVQGNEAVGYYPGTDMTSEGNGWFYYTYDPLPQHSPVMQFVNWIGPQLHVGRVEYSYKFSIDSMLALYPTNELWIVILDTLQPPVIYDVPPNSKVIKLFNPWPDNSPQMIIGNNAPLRMQHDDEHCGWYIYYYAGSLDRLTQLKFTDYFHTQIYSSDGMSDKSPPIDLQSTAELYDTIYILPRPFPYGPPSITSTFPGRTGDCGVRKISGLFRDWKQDDISFFNNPTGMSGGDSTGMILPYLSEPDYKPKRNPNSSARNAEELESWYETITFEDGTTNETCVDIELKKGDDGLWEYDSDWIGGFFLIDDFDNPNNIKYEDSREVEHNFHFTMEMHLQFIYHEGAGLAFYFRGDDDVWIFVNNTLAIDLGGLHERAADTLLLDREKNRLGLVDGQTYTMDIFYAERNPVGANFLLRTSMDIKNSDELYYKEKDNGNGQFQYDIWQRIVSEEQGCGTTRLIDEEGPARVDFYLEGPQFPGDSLFRLTPGTHFDGLIVDENKYRITLDSSKINGLVYGEYRIIFKSSVNEERTGYLVFYIEPNPHHLDILTTSTEFDQNNDANVDTIVIPIESDSIKIYSVIRDPSGKYIQIADFARWTSNDNNAFSLIPSESDPSQQIIVKSKTGNGWIKVSQDSLLSDSVYVMVYAKPNWPIINMATMLDNNGDIIPDLLHITLSDTFQTGQYLTSVIINYEGQQYQVDSDLCTLNRQSLSVPFQSQYGIDGTPTGSVTIEVSVDDEMETHTKEFSDGVGPGLIQAEVLENDGTEADILFLTFSENVFPATIIGMQLLLVKAENLDTVPLEISSIINLINDSSFSVILSPSGNNRPLPGDKLRLIPGNSGGTIADLNQNLPHELNPSVVLGFKPGAAPVNSSFYQDIDADGLIDKITINFKRKVDISEFDSIRIYWNLKHHILSASDFTTENDTSVIIHTNESVRGNIPLTGGLMHLSVYFKAVPGVTRNSYAQDKASPVITSAILIPGKYLETGDHKPDTLVVTFSEFIQSPGNHPFTFSNISDSYNLTLSFNRYRGEQYLFLVDAIEPDFIIPSTGDTVRIDTTAHLRDTIGNAQLHPKNRPVLLKVIEPAHEWRVNCGPNPILKNQSVIIQVFPFASFDITKYSSSITFFDAVGNKVKYADMKISNGKFDYEWNGRNHFGRLVGSGTYAGIITIKKNYSDVWKKMIKIGVNRR